jgi:hypothetical protein
MSRSGLRPIRYRRNTPAWFKDRLKRLALEINVRAADAAKHQRKAVIHALKVGARLNAAKRLLDAWAERARRVREYDPPPRFGAWLAENFQGSRRGSCKLKGLTCKWLRFLRLAALVYSPSRFKCYRDQEHVRLRLADVDLDGGA